MIDPLVPFVSVGPRGVLRRLAMGMLLAGLGACATSPPVDAQWSDPQLAAHSGLLRGDKVLIACNTPDVTLRQICLDQVAGELVARGATPVTMPADMPMMMDRPIDEQLLAAAGRLGAKAVFVAVLAPATAEANQGFSLGIGGFGFGRNSAVGVGVAVPVGGGTVTTGFLLNGRVLDVATGKLVWTARAVSTPSSDINAQLGQLSKSVLGSAETAGLF